MAVAPQAKARTVDEELLFLEVPAPDTPNPAAPNDVDRSRGYQLWCHNPIGTWSTRPRCRPGAKMARV